VTTPIVLPWPLQSSLEAATRVLFEPVDRPSLDFSQPAGEAALVSPNSVSWRVFKNPLSLFIGGVTAVIMELAEPRVHTGVWDKAGQRSLARSALVEVAEQLARALAQISTLPATPALRREEIKLQVALINSLMHVKGYAAPETKEAGKFADRAGGGVGRGARRPAPIILGSRDPGHGMANRGPLDIVEGEDFGAYCRNRRV
jgi:hypothetical protein